MKIKSLLIFVFTLMSLTAFAQSGGIKGKVVSREGRVAVDGVKVSVTPGEMTATTDGRGGFVIENVEPGEYTLQFEAPEFEPLTLVVRVDKMVRDINTVILVPEVLFTFPSRYWFTIGLSGVFSLAGWSRQIHAEFLVFRATQDTAMLRFASNTGLSPSVVSLSRLFFSRNFLQQRGPTTPYMP